MQYNEKIEDIKDYIVYSLSFIVFIYAIITIIAPSRGNIFCGNKKALVGVWERDMNDLREGFKEVWYFGKDGSFKNAWECDEYSYYSPFQPKTFAIGNYKVRANKITLNYDGVTEDLSYSISNSKQELRIGSDASGYKTFQRAY